jgi:nucleotide-binding universal stress UspA family protein
MAVELALEISKVDHSTIETIHFYGVPLGYNKTGKSYNKFADIMKNIAKNDFGAFLKKHTLSPDISCEFVLSEHGKYPEHIYDYAEKNEIDLIVIGSRGRTDISSLVMGSVAEKLVYLEGQIPMLIVKEKGENMSFLEVLMEL